jgi:ferritin-like metal-binding protein YciE
MKMQSLQDLLLDHLKDTYDAEHQIVEALPKMEQAASSSQVKKAFQEHLRQTEGQIQRLERVFQMMGQKASRKTCKGMKGLIQEGQEIIDHEASAEVKDAGLIAAAQKVEHYEMAAYGTARTYCQLLEQHECAQLLQETLDEEELTDKKLSQIAAKVNLEAAQ